VIGEPDGERRIAPVPPTIDPNKRRGLLSTRNRVIIRDITTIGSCLVRGLFIVIISSGSVGSRRGGRYFGGCLSRIVRQIGILKIRDGLLKVVLFFFIIIFIIIFTQSGPAVGTS